ncbi:hypothetical protein NFI96_004025 [Prochilodus magdalenae]|nr:hypothetical protein NFI96_004025 [Prochilodus magdalenae]
MRELGDGEEKEEEGAGVHLSQEVQTVKTFAATAVRNSHLSTQRWLKYNTVLLDLPNITVKRCTVLNPAALLPTQGDGEPHDCVALTNELCSPRTDLKDEPLHDPDLVLYVDGSASRDPETALERSAAPDLTLHNSKIKFLLYAEDLVLLSPTEQGLQQSLDLLEQYCRAWALAAIDDPEVAIVVLCQNQGFPQEMARLRNGQNVDKKSSIFRLDPVLNQVILRVGGRLSKMAMPEEQKHPAILPKEHHVSRLVLRHIHQPVGHSGKTTCCLPYEKVLDSLRKFSGKKDHE